MALFLACAGSASAQVPFIGDLIKALEDVEINWTPAGWMLDRDFWPERVRGYSIEVSFLRGSWTHKSSEPATPTAVQGQAGSRAQLEDSLVSIEVRVHDSDTVETRTYVPRSEPLPKKDPPDPWGFAEVSIGYGQLFGLSTTRFANAELRGSLEDFPMLAVYLAWAPGAVSLYAGPRVGVSRLSGFRGYITTAPGTATAYGATGTTLALGGTLGLLWTAAEQIGFFADVTVVGRTFNNIEWGSAGSATPTALPRRLDLGTTTVSLGAQFTFKAP